MAGATIVVGLPMATASDDPTATLTDTTVSHAGLPDGAAALGQGRMAEHAGRSYLLYAARFSNAPWVQVRDETSGATSHIALPPGATGGTAWARADIAVAGSDLWILSGAGPAYLRHYRLSGSPMPTTATAVAERVLGNSDSRAGALTALASGNAVGVWHQQGMTTPHGLHVVHATPAGAIRTTEPVTMVTRSSTQAIAQHPADGTVWVFSSADAAGAIAAVRLTEVSTGMRIDAVDTGLITDRYGADGPDPEAPDVEAVPDAATGSIAVAYQSADRRVFSTQPWVVGSRIAVARVAPDASVSFLARAPDHTERISAIGLVVRAGETWVTSRPVAADLSFDTAHVRRHDGSAWSAPIALGKLGDPRATVYSGRTILNVGGAMADNLVHLFVAGPVTSAPSGDAGSAGDGGSTTTTSKAKGGGRRR